MARTILSGLLLLSLLPGTVMAQRFGEAVEVSVVEIPVTVVDRAGKPVTGLTKESFEVYDDGRRTPIEYFEVVDLTTVTAAPGRPIPPVAYRNFLLLFDMANAKPGSMSRAQAAARAFVDSSLTERDLVGVAIYSPSKGLRMVTSFSSDRALVSGAIAAIGSSSEFRVADPLLLFAPGLLGALPTRGGSGIAGEAKGEAEQAYMEERQGYDRATKAAQDAEQAARVRNQLQNFGGVARALDGLKGQKQIILLSEGFDPRHITGRQDSTGQTAQEENAAIASGEIWKVDSDERYGSASGVREINDMATVFRRSDVRLHAIDIKGLRSDVDAREGVQKSSNEGLFMMTRPTGGTVFKNANDMNANFDSLLKRQQIVYLLGITSRPSGKAGKFHTLKVKSTVRGAELTHRTGYHENTPANDLERTLGLAEILVTDAKIEDIPLTVQANAAPGDRDIARVPVVVDIPGQKLLEGVSGASATANIFVYAFDQNQQVHDFMQQRVVLDVAKTGDALRRTGARFLGGLRLKPGTYAIKALVRVEETGRTGFLRTELVVPAFADRSVLAPLAMGDAANWVTLVSPTRGEDAAAILSVGPQPFVPISPVRLQAGTPLRIALMIYRLPIADLGISPMVVGSDGSSRPAAVTLVGRTQPDSIGLTKLVFEFKPDGLQPGSYELRLKVTPKDAAESTVMLPFTIE